VTPANFYGAMVFALNMVHLATPAMSTLINAIESDAEALLRAVEIDGTLYAWVDSTRNANCASVKKRHYEAALANLDRLSRQTWHDSFMTLRVNVARHKQRHLYISKNLLQTPAVDCRGGISSGNLERRAEGSAPCTKCKKLDNGDNARFVASPGGESSV